MALPKDAILEAELDDNVAIYDVSHLLPKHPSARYHFRKPRDIRTCIYHKSGADGRPGYDGLENCVAYCIRSKQPNYPGAPYHFWLARIPDEDAHGKLVIYRAQPDNVHSWHSGGPMNKIGISIACQGNYDGQWDLITYDTPKIEREPTHEQWRMLEALLPYQIARYALDGVNGGKHPDGVWTLSGHWEHGKAVCPGDALRSWIIRKRASTIMLVPEQSSIIMISSDDEIDVERLSVRELQRALTLLGYDPGPADGVRGYRTRAALETFQRDHRLNPDGWYGIQSAAALLASLRARGLASREAFRKGGIV
jgi:hypothetical protein